MTGLADTARSIALTGVVTDADNLAVRRAVFADGIVSRVEAEAIFAIERARTAHSNAWSELFVEALSDYSLNQEEPVGYLSEDTAAWISAEISKRKAPSTDADLELVTNIIEKARQVPLTFSAFALRMAKAEVIYGDGPDARGRMHIHGRVTEADVITLKRILWGAGSEGHLAISRDEAEALVAIADATTGAENDPAFDDLFARAIGNYLIGATGRSVPTRADALIARTRGTYTSSLGGALSAFQNMMRPSADDVREGWDMVRHGRSLTDQVSLATEAEHHARNEARQTAMAVAEVMTPDKAGWLLDHVGKNGVMTGPEKSLVRFIAREASALDASLKDVIAKVA